MSHPEHITVTEAANGRIDAECGKCHARVDFPARFGGIPGEVMLAHWIKQHAHKAKVRGTA